MYTFINNILSFDNLTDFAEGLKYLKSLPHHRYFLVHKGTQYAGAEGSATLNIQHVPKKSTVWRWNHATTDGIVYSRYYCEAGPLFEIVNCKNLCVSIGAYEFSIVQSPLSELIAATVFGTDNIKSASSAEEGIFKHLAKPLSDVFIAYLQPTTRKKIDLTPILSSIFNEKQVAVITRKCQS